MLPPNTRAIKTRPVKPIHARGARVVRETSEPIRSPVQAAIPCSSSGATMAGARPINIQPVASTVIGAIIRKPDSRACGTCSERFTPRNTVNFNKTGYRQSADPGQSRDCKSGRSPRRRTADSYRSKQPQVDEELADETIERWQA